MASEIQVYKAAATAVGSSAQIASPTDDRPVARAIRNVWDIQRRAALREGAWNFAMHRKGLPALAAAPEFGFDYQYQVPSDFLRLVEVFGEARDHYQLEGEVILADQSGPLQIRYIRDIAEPASWDDEFVEAFALRIAWKIGTKIAGSSFDKDDAWRNYQIALRSAKSTDGAENPPIDQEESAWVEARYVGLVDEPFRGWAD